MLSKSLIHDIYLSSNFTKILYFVNISAIIKMGKGFNNYMCKKFFHPASRDNLKRVWMAEQQAEAYKKKQEELRMQYEKEQDLHNNKALLSKESKEKLSVNFMYEPPPGAKKEREKEDNEPEYKFEWQRKYNAPRESYCKGDSEIRDQPFGIQVRNVRCIKCHKWGHINTDKECPLYSQAMSVVLAINNNTDLLPPAPDALALVQQMRDDGLELKKSALNAQQHLSVPHNQDLMVSEDEQSEVAFLKSLSKKEKRKLLKKLEKLEKKRIKKKKSKKKKNSLKNSCSSDSSRNSNVSDNFYFCLKKEKSEKRKNEKLKKKTKEISSWKQS
ncbi:PREDICTED: corepressor interacting with RBPJ 1 [Ceratosolen solmsi marchali]|uniref:Corepressor interacting with RBPJ 1 n=1 Tax=Ceratosolen solmsi marchali TaxID=326594 RepID=A0AAJ6YSK1_9HYME|nr:PREDICTED: corepressor interacting with RBPJ 1 [Ceratosolen solmsi marchali]